VSFWHHFPADQVYGSAAVAAHIQHAEAFDLDFLKVMDDNNYPHDTRIESVGDLASLTVLQGDEPEFSRQLDLLSDLRRAFGGRLLMATTVFNAWTSLRRLVRPSTSHKPPNLNATSDLPSERIKKFLSIDADAVENAIRIIAMSLANFVRRCLVAGADGLFLSVRDDWLDSAGGTPNLYNALVRPADLAILDAACAGTFNVLHVCGKAVDFRAFADYPVHAINWADRAAGPSIADVCTWAKPAVCAGIDNLTTLPNGTPTECHNEVTEALAQAGDRPIIVASGCTYDPERVPRENLQAVCRAVRG
jgi:uroporphyrinogen decarboxylase